MPPFDGAPEQQQHHHQHQQGYGQQQAGTPLFVRGMSGGDLGGSGHGMLDAPDVHDLREMRNLELRFAKVGRGVERRRAATTWRAETLRINATAAARGAAHPHIY